LRSSVTQTAPPALQAMAAAAVISRDMAPGLAGDLPEPVDDVEYDQGYDTLCGNPPGYHKDDGTFCLDGFPVENAYWCEGRVECFQTMGRLTLLYRLDPEDDFLTPTDISVEASSWRLEVSRSSYAGGSDRKVKIEALCGDLAGGLRRRLCAWALDDSSGGKVLVFSFIKLDYTTWKRLWSDSAAIKSTNSKGRFIWNSKQTVPDDVRHLSAIPHDEQAVLDASEHTMDPADLCLCLDDMELIDEGSAFYIHFDVEKYLALEAVVPLEQIVRADVKENHISIYLHSSEEHADVPIFEAELGFRCVPERTIWQLLRCRKGILGRRGQAYNAALQVVLCPHPDDEEHVGPLFLWRRHVDDIIATQRRAKEVSYKECEDKLRLRSEELCGPTGALAAADPGAALDGPPRPLKPYLLDNSTLQATTKGLGYRLSKQLNDKDGDEHAEWGTVVTGTDQGQGWLKVGPRYLPFSLGGKSVLISQTFDLGD